MWIASSQGLLAMTERTVMAGLVGDTSGVIPGRCGASNPESRDSGSGPSDHPGMTECRNVDCFVARAPRNDGEDRHGRACCGYFKPHSGALRRSDPDT